MISNRLTAGNQVNTEMIKLIQTQNEILAKLKNESASSPHQQGNVNEIQTSEASQSSEISELTTASKQLINNFNVNNGNNPTFALYDYTKDH